MIVILHTVSTMRRRTFTLSDDLSDALDREAMLRCISVSEVVRTLLEVAFSAEDQPNEIPWANIGTADGPPWAADVDDYLERNWAKDIEARRG